MYLRYDIIWQCTDRPPKDIIAAKAGIGAFPAAARQPFVTSRMNSKKRVAPGGICKVDKPSHTVLKITTQAHIFYYVVCGVTHGTYKSSDRVAKRKRNFAFTLFLRRFIIQSH